MAVLALMMMAAIGGCKPTEATTNTESNHGIAAPSRPMSSAPSEPLSTQSPDRTSPAQPTTTPDSRPIIVCFGDSLTAGYGVEPDASYPSRLQEALDAAGYHYRVLNMGISGETTKDGLSRVDRVIALHPSITVVEFGGNDGLRGIPITSSRANLDSIVARLQPSGTHIALAGITLPPQFGMAYVQQFNQTYHVIATKYHVPLYPFLLKDVYGVPGSIQPDGIHPTAQGCRQVAKNIMGFLQPLLKK